jgi:hypothetical protein
MSRYKRLDNIQFFIIRDDLGNETNMKNSMGVHFCSVKGCQLIAKLNHDTLLSQQRSCVI